MIYLLKRYIEVVKGVDAPKNLPKKRKINSFSTPIEQKKQGIVDDSARKPALRQDTGYMVEKTYTDIPPYLRAFGA